MKKQLKKQEKQQWNKMLSKVFVKQKFGKIS